MLVNEIRKSLVESVGRVAAGGDEVAVAMALSHTRAILVALANYPDDEQVSLEDLTVRTDTAATILGLHREYVRNLVRAGQLPAKKLNGEFEILLSEVAGYALRTSIRKGDPSSPSGHADHVRLTLASYSGPGFVQIKFQET